jgi:hypothetical protein
MGRVLPNAMVLRAFRNLGLPEDRLPPDLDEIVNQGLQQLYGFQHGDGAWGWWYDDDNNLYQTAYVIYGLVMTEQVGYAVDEGVLARGVAATEALLAEATDPRTRAFALYVLSTAGHGDLAAAQALLGEKDQLDYFAQAALALALAQEGDAAGADELMDDLAAAAVETATTAHWPQSEQDGTYNLKVMASTTRATALVLEAFTQVRPASPLLPKAARWLMNKRIGGHWRTTQETSYAILALADYVQVSGELEPDYGYQVYLNDALLSSGVISAANAMEPLAPIVATFEQLVHGDNTVRIVKDGTGQLYYTLSLHTSYLSDGFVAVQPAGSGISVTRRYRLAYDGYPSSFEVGDLIEVHLSVEADDEAWYVIIEDPLPAGAEALNERLNTTSHAASQGGDLFWWWLYGYNRKAVYDDRVALFVTRLSAGRHEYDYLMRATTPGQFSVLPTHVYLMYDPDTWARSASQRCYISPNQVRAPFWFAGDLDRDCRVNDFDLNQVVVPWNTQAGEPGYYATSDLNGDGDVDVTDVVRVAANWGSVCSLDPPALTMLHELGPALRLEPASLSVTAGQSFSVSVRLDLAGETTTLNGYQFRLDFDPALAQVNDLAPRPGYEALGPQVDAVAGQATCGAYRYGAGMALEPGASLATIAFTALEDGTLDLSLSDVRAAQVGPPLRFYLPFVFKND